MSLWLGAGAVPVFDLGAGPAHPLFDHLDVVPDEFGDECVDVQSLRERPAVGVVRFARDGRPRGAHVGGPLLDRVDRGQGIVLGSLVGEEELEGALETAGITRPWT